MIQTKHQQPTSVAVAQLDKGSKKVYILFATQYFRIDFFCIFVVRNNLDYAR